MIAKDSLQPECIQKVSAVARLSHDSSISHRLNDYSRKVDDWFTNNVSYPRFHRITKA